jgi:hypothetical protein
MNNIPARLARIEILVRDSEALVPVYRAICGIDPQTINDETRGVRIIRFHLSTAIVDLIEPDAQYGLASQELSTTLDLDGPGLYACIFSSPNPIRHLTALHAAGIESVQHLDGIHVHLNGLRAQITSADLDTENAARGDAHLDHIAMRVRNLDSAASIWAATTGSSPLHMGIHPVSEGTFEATRLILDDQMIELIQPVSGLDSVVANRLESHGEGVQTLALIARDLDQTIQRIEATNVRLIHQPPHVFVHPVDTAGILIQLTPRVNH